MMEILCWLALSVALIRLIVALTNYLVRQPLSKVPPVGEDTLVSLIVPARNEAEHLESLLYDLNSQQGVKVEILVYDDESTDATATIVQTTAAADARVRLLSSTGLPPGWLGKNHACHEAALHAQGDYLLFVDADVNLEPTLVVRAVEYVKKHQLSLLSIFPRQRCETLGEQLTVPLMNLILLSLLPLVLIRRSRRPVFSAANGQFMLFEAAAYHRLQPHQHHKADRVEDIRIARFYKQQRLRIATLAAEPDLTCRMYTSYDTAIEGFSKNVLQFFGGSALLAVLYWAITTLGIFPVVAVFGLDGLLLYGGLAVLIRILVSLTSHQPVADNLIYMIPQQVTLALMLFKAMTKTARHQLIWKDRAV